MDHIIDFCRKQDKIVLIGSTAVYDGESGSIETDLLMARYGDEQRKRELVSEIPVGRLGKPEDIAGLVALLLSTWGDYICGQQIAADGGRTLFNR